MLGQRGLSIIEVLVSVGIMGIIMMSIVSLQTNMSKENRALTEKLAANDLTRVIITALSNPATCKLIFQRPGNLVTGQVLTFNPASAVYPFTVDFKALPESATTDVVSLANPTVSSLSSSVKVKSSGGIQVQVKTATTGAVLVNFDQSRLARTIKDLSFPISIGTTGSGAGTRLDSCTASSGAPPANPGSACGSGIVMFDQSGTRACCTVLGTGGEYFGNATMACSAF